jgi:hypothetical protein
MGSKEAQPQAISKTGLFHLIQHLDKVHSESTWTHIEAGHPLSSDPVTHATGEKAATLPEGHPS